MAGHSAWKTRVNALASRPSASWSRLPLPGQSRTHRARRRAGLAVAIIQRVLIEQREDIRPFVVRSHHQAGAGGEGAPQRLLFVAGRIGALQARDEGVALLLGDDQRGEAAAPSLDLGDPVALPGPGAEERHLLAERRRCDEYGENCRIQNGLHVDLHASMFEPRTLRVSKTLLAPCDGCGTTGPRRFAN